MRVLNDFKCIECDTLYADKLVDNETTTIDCLSCEGFATRVRSVPNFSLPYNDPAGFPTAHQKWEQKREQQIKHELKTNPES
jgi:hypothetical protein